MSANELVAITSLTLRVGLVATASILPPAVALGYVLARREFPGRSVVQAMVALPMVLPPVAVGLALLLLLGRRGPLGDVWSLLGWISCSPGGPPPSPPRWWASRF